MPPTNLRIRLFPAADLRGSLCRDCDNTALVADQIERKRQRELEKSGLCATGHVASQIGIQVRHPISYIHLIGVMDSVLKGVRGDAQGYSDVQLARKYVYVFF